MINTVVLVGRLTKNPQEYATATGTTIATFTIAVNNGKDDGASFIDCRAFNKTAETIIRWCTKGKQIGVTGKLVQRKYTTKDGANRSTLEVLCDSVEFLDDVSDRAPAKENPEQQPAQNPTPKAPEQNVPQSTANESDAETDDLPF